MCRIKKYIYIPRYSQHPLEGGGGGGRRPSLPALSDTKREKKPSRVRSSSIDVSGGGGGNNLAGLMPTREETKTWLRLAADKAREGLSWVGEDLRKPHLFWVKVVFLFQSASMVTLYPYLTLHLRSLGFDLEGRQCEPDLMYNTLIARLDAQNTQMRKDDDEHFFTKSRAFSDSPKKLAHKKLKNSLLFFFGKDVKMPPKKKCAFFEHLDKYLHT